MPVYRGPGGAGDATNDATVTAVQSAATAAATSATAAANSATAAANSATGAATSATNAANSATTAAGQATTAAGHATNASTFATNSSLSATDSADSALEAQQYASEANDSEVAASASASAAATSATNAGTSATNSAASAASALAIYGNTTAMNNAVAAASTSASNAATSASNASTSATTATNAASTATTQAAAALVSANNADADATAASIDANEAQAAATAATAALNNSLSIYGSISAVQDAASNSLANRDAAAASATSASNSASTATTQAGIATTQATNAATSAAQASAVALGNEPVRHSVRPSLLLDFANTKTLDPRITYTRASAGTYYDGKTVAKAEENLFVRSQEFDNASWVKSSLVTVTTNSTIAPDGTTTAETLVSNTGTVNTGLYQAATTVVGNTFSVYAKAGTSNFVGLTTSFSNATPWANFNLSTGAVASSSGCTASIVSVGNGWYRCVMANTTVAGQSFCYIVGKDADPANNPWNTGTWTSGNTIFLWGAQLEQRSTVTAYTATTTAPITNYVPVLLSAPANVARFEHNPVTGESLGLEIEEQRTNLQPNSSNGASWTNNATTTTTAANIAPDGTLTANLIVATATTAVHYVNLQQQTISNATVYTASIYVKSFGINYLNFTGDSAAGSLGSGVGFDLITNTVSALGAGVTSASITPVGNGWYRLTLTATSSNVFGTLAVGLRTSAGSGFQSYAGNGFSGIYIWGAQLEAGAFATSYIPTTVSQVTRSADSASMTGTNFSSWYRTDEGTLYAEAATISNGNAAVYGIGDSTSSVIRLFRQNSNQAAYQVVTNGAFAANSGMATTWTSGFAKVVSVYKTDDFSTSFNGGTPVTDASGVVPVLNTVLTLGSAAGVVTLNGTIKKLAYYPKRLTNAELQGLTTV